MCSNCSNEFWKICSNFGKFEHSNKVRISPCLNIYDGVQHLCLQADLLVPQVSDFCTPFLSSTFFLRRRGRQREDREKTEEGEKRSAFGSRGMCRCVVKTTKRFDYVTKLATTTAELRAVASLRSTVFREEYDKLITIASAIASPQVT